MLQLIIKNTNINELNPSLEIKLVIHNITNQTLKYKHKNVQTMVRILLLNEEGLQLNFDEVKPKEKNRNNLPLETLTLKAGTSKSFYLNYPLRDYTTDLQNIVPLFIQAQIILSKYNENQIKYGIVRSNRVELTKLD